MATTYTDNNPSAGDGSRTEFRYTFPVIQTEDVKVSLNGVTQATTKYTVDNVSNPTHIDFNNTSIDSSVQENSGAPKTGVRVRVYRKTTVGKTDGNEDPKAVFAAGSSIRAIDLNANQEQSLMAIHELQTRPIETEDIQGDAITGDKIADDQINSEHYVAGSIDLEHMSANSVDSDQYVDGSIDGVHIANDQIDSQHYAAGSIDLEHMSANSVDSDQYVDGSIDHVHLANDVIDGDNIQDDVINSEHYAALSIDTEHIANENVTTAKLENNAVVNSKLADNAVDSRNYVDGSIDHVHLANDAVDGDNIADDSINSEHYVDLSIDTQHIGNLQVTTGKIADGAITDAKIQGGSLDNRYYTETELDAGQLDNRYFTETELTNGALDGRYFTETEADARYFNISTGDTVKDGDTFPDNDTTIATTAAINDRIIDLVDDVGGFVPIANETSFPTANPDVNGGAGTIVSVKEASTNLAPSGTTVTIANGRGTGNAVIITGVSATIPSGFGFLVETTTTDHTYAFHRLVPKATEVTTVAGKAVEIGRLGTADAVADMALLGTADVVADLNTLGTADVVADMNMLATSDVISDMNTLAVTDVVNDMDTVATNVTNVNNVGNNIANVNTTAGSIANVNTVAGSISNVNTTAGSISNVNSVAGSISNVNTTANNITDVNTFANRYRIGSSDPSTNNDEGDLFFNTTSDELRVYNGSTWQGGVTATGNLAGLGSNTFTGNQSHGDNIKNLFGTGNDLEIYHNGNDSVIDEVGTGDLKIRNGGANKLIVSGTGIGVTGNITVSGNVDGRDVAADGSKLDGIATGATAFANVVEDTSPQLGGALDVNGQDITSTSNGNIDINPHGSGLAVFLGNSTKGSGAFKLNCEANSHGITIKGPPHSAGQNYTLTFPSSLTNNGVLTTNSSGTLSAGLLGTSNIADDAITANQIADNAVNSAAIANDSITANELANNSVGDSHIINETITNSEINGSAAIAGTKISPDFGSQNIVTTGTLASDDISITSTEPRIRLLDSNNNPDYSIYNSNGVFAIYDETNTSDRIVVNTDGHVDVTGNLDVGAGLDVTGNITVTGTVDGVDLQTLNTAVAANTAKVTNATHTGDVTGSTSLTLAASGVSAGSYGSSTAIPVITVDAKGRITSASTATTSSDLVADTTPQLGGNLDTNGFHILSDDDEYVRFGSGSDLRILHTGGVNVITSDTGTNIRLVNHLTGGNETMAQFIPNGAAELYWNGAKKLETTTSGVTVTGTVAATSYTGDGSNLTGIASTVAGGAIYENSQTISADHTIPVGSNGMSAGPVTVNNNITLTISNGSTYTIV